MTGELQNRVFPVLREPFCLWGYDIEEANREFLKGIDEGYFVYVAERHVADLDGEASQRAALAIRTNYHLVLETLFGLIGALLQAPDCMAAWILRVRSEELREFISSIETHKMTFPLGWEKGDELRGFGGIAALILQNTTWTREPNDKTAEHFSNLIARLAHDFVDRNAISEYNSIKHGFRARAGGFHLKVGLEKQFGVSPPPHEMKLMGSSKFGASYFVAEQVEGAPTVKSRDTHFRLRRVSNNWSAESTAQRTALAAMCIENIKSFGLILSGSKPGEVRFSRAENPDDYFAPWETSPGVLNMNFDRIIREAQIKRFTKKELTEFLSNREVGPTDD